MGFRPIPRALLGILNPEPLLGAFYTPHLLRPQHYHPPPGLLLNEAVSLKFGP
jgi:hypothetical protein